MRSYPHSEAARRWAVVGLILILGSSAACLGGAEAEGRQAKGVRGSRAAKVVVAAVREGAVRGAWTFPGDVRARARATLGAGAEGPVRAVYPRIGDRFKKGGVLVEIDRALAVARWSLAKARVKEATELLAQAEREAGRLRSLAQGVVPEQEREQAVSRRATAVAALEARKAEASEARVLLERHRVGAPFNGVVGDRMVDPGDWVRVGDPVLEVVSVDDVDIVVDAGQALLPKVQVGSKAWLADAPQVVLRIAGVVPALDPVTRTLRIRLAPLEPLPADWVPGRSVKVTFEVDFQESGAVVVPQDALLFDGEKSRVVKVTDGKAQSVSVEVLRRSGGEALVTAAAGADELGVGDPVIVRGNERVRPGQPVVISEGSTP